MIISVNEARLYVVTMETDEVLAAKLSAIESLIRKYTNNNFQDRRYRTSGTTTENKVDVRDASIFAVGDTLMIDNDLCVIESIEGNTFTLDKYLLAEEKCLVTKIVYPQDVVIGAINMLKWDLENRDKVGIQSETISRHSVTYFNMDGENSNMGYPKSLLGFLKPYMRARF